MYSCLKLVSYFLIYINTLKRTGARAFDPKKKTIVRETREFSCRHIKTSSGTHRRKITYSRWFSELICNKRVGFFFFFIFRRVEFFVLNFITMVVTIYAVSLRRLTMMVITTYLFQNSKTFSRILSSGN